MLILKTGKTIKGRFTIIPESINTKVSTLANNTLRFYLQGVALGRDVGASGAKL